jgi:DNA-3-methyladenine glycosylase
MDGNNYLSLNYFKQDVLIVAPGIVGNYLVVRKNDNTIEKHIITETEAYRGEEDLACHASKGRTKRTEVMYKAGGHIYVYLIYGMYWMINFVTGKQNEPQAVLIRGINDYNGPGKLTKALGIDGSYNGKLLNQITGIWVEKSGLKPELNIANRIGVDYAGEIWKNKHWRFTMKVL